MKTKARLTRTRLAAGIMMIAMLGLAIPAEADRYRRGASHPPLRIVSYVLHPVGIALEYGVMRPIHWVVSQPHLDIVFGHQPALDDDGTYFEWVHGDYSPSIAEERKRQREAAAEGEE